MPHCLPASISAHLRQPAFHSLKPRAAPGHCACWRLRAAARARAGARQRPGQPGHHGDHEHQHDRARHHHLHGRRLLLLRLAEHQHHVLQARCCAPAMALPQVPSIQCEPHTRIHPAVQVHISARALTEAASPNQSVWGLCMQMQPCASHCSVAQRPMRLTRSVGSCRSNVATPFPGKIGDGSEPALLSCNADGIHSASSYIGPQVRFACGAVDGICAHPF